MHGENLTPSVQTMPLPILKEKERGLVCARGADPAGAVEIQFGRFYGTEFSDVTGRKDEQDRFVLLGNISEITNDQRRQILHRRKPKLSRSSGHVRGGQKVEHFLHALLHHFDVSRLVKEALGA